MAHFLRDQRIENVTVTENMVKQIGELFINRTIAFNASIPEDDNTGRKAIYSFIIRFDNKGYRVFFLEDLLLYFQQAKEIERLLFTIETGESLQSNRIIGAAVELGLDKSNKGGFLSVTSNDRDWVDASFSAVQDVLIKCKNKNGWVRTPWMQLLVQITGVAFGFFISLWAATKISPKLSIQNSFVICFLFVLLIFSNTWSYLNKLILETSEYYFPSINFYRSDKDRWDWFMQAIIAGLVITMLLWILGLVFSYAGTILASFVAKSS